jgi:hypothetical protein
VNNSYENGTITLDKTLSNEALNVTGVDVITGISYADYSHAENYGTVASGWSSHAEGYSTIASGERSHAEGDRTVAFGQYSHAEGYNTTASGEASHAEGYGTIASNWRAHAEGDQTIASGVNSHAEGYYTLASGFRAHAENYRASAIGNDSHAEGYETTAYDTYSHAEGAYVIASGYASHAEGYNTDTSLYLTGDANATTYTIESWDGDEQIQIGAVIKTNKNYAKIVNYNKANSTITLDKTLSSSAINNFYVSLRGRGALRNYSHAEGYKTIASGNYGSHAEGNETLASGISSHVEGFQTKALSDYQHVQGKFNIEDTKNKYAHIVGNGNYNTLSNAHTLDWNGNAWFAGDVYIGGTEQNDINSASVITEKSINLPRNYFSLIDLDNGYTYIIQMKSGNLVTRRTVSSIKVTTMPNKIDYYLGEYFDPTGMVVTATCEDGSVIDVTNYIYSDNSFAIDGDTVTILYNEAGKTYTTTITVNIIEFDAATILIDFEYITNDDGTYTITAWKGTKNGVASTEMVVPDISNIIL